LLLIRLGLKLLSLQTLKRYLDKVFTSPQIKSKNSVSLYKIIWSITTASSYMPQVKCLARALAAKTLLEQQGYSVMIKIGVAKNQQQAFIAHAWVECKGRVVIGGIGNSVRKYQVMPIEDF
ncbi:MAG: lasso peptide biosynthesis B2 protein, partial [Cyanobacteria bacterium P01_F01_bin.143]